MTTEAQVATNRLNAQKSTGPRTAEGKAAVAQNAVKHGLRAQAVVLPGEEPDQYDRYHQEMMDQLHPEDLPETDLAERIVGLTWRLRRAGRYHDAVFEALYEQQAAEAAESAPPETEAGAALRRRPGARANVAGGLCRAPGPGAGPGVRAEDREQPVPGLERLAEAARPAPAVGRTKDPLLRGNRGYPGDPNA